jgi:hypothetical protein
MVTTKALACNLLDTSFQNILISLVYKTWEDKMTRNDDKTNHFPRLDAGDQLAKRNVVKRMSVSLVIAF